MYLKIFLELLIATLAVMGLYTVFRILLVHLCREERIFTVIEVQNEADVGQAQELIREVLTDVLMCRKQRIALLIPQALETHAEIERLRDRYGLECLVRREDHPED